MFDFFCFGELYNGVEFVVLHNGVMHCCCKLDSMTAVKLSNGEIIEVDEDEPCCIHYATTLKDCVKGKA